MWQREFVYSAWGKQATCVIISLVSPHKTSIAFNSTQTFSIFHVMGRNENGDSSSMLICDIKRAEKPRV